MRSRRLALLAALGGVLLLTPSLEAQAAASYGPVRVIRGCAGDTHAAETADGTVWATTSCGAESYTTPDFLRPGASAWTRRGDRGQGRSLAVTDDGRYTYTIVSYHGSSLNLVKIQHDAGYFGNAGLARDGKDFQPSVVAVEGHYWAVWSQETCAADGSGCRRALFQQRSLGAAPSTVEILAVQGSSAESPSLGLHDGGVVMTFIRADASGNRTLRIATADLAGGGWNETAFPTGSDAQVTATSLAVSGGRTIVTWVAGGRAFVSIDDGSLRFATPRAIPYRAPVGQIRAAASGGHASIATSACFSLSGQRTCRVYVAETGLTGPVSSTEVSSASGPIVWQLEDLVAARGRATVLMDTGSALVSRGQSG